MADNIILGNTHSYKGSIGTSVAKVFDLTVATAGANAKLLKANSIEYISSYTHGASHAGYYPDALPLAIKILFAPGTAACSAHRSSDATVPTNASRCSNRSSARAVPSTTSRSWSMPMRPPTPRPRTR